MKRVDFMKFLRRTPWHIYTSLLAVLLWAGIGAFYLGYWAAGGQVDEPTEEPVKVVKTVVTVPEVEEPVVVVEPEEPAYTEQDLETLALIIYQEAGGDACSDETREMVGTVVLNRVASDRFPDTIEEVALQRKQYGRLCWTGLVWPERAQDVAEVHAVERAYTCAEKLLSGYRALPGDVIYQAEFPQGTEVVAHLDGMYFCR